jgi:hypothetical protein
MPKFFRQSSMTEGPDNLLMQVKMQNGAIGQCFASYTAKIHKELFFKLNVLGKEGSLELVDGEVSWTRGSEWPSRFSTDRADRAIKLNGRTSWQPYAGRNVSFHHRSRPTRTCSSLTRRSNPLRPARALALHQGRPNPL